MYHTPSKDWDKKEKRMDESDMATVDDPEDKEKVNVVTEEEGQDFPISGLFCCFCHDYAVHIYDGMSLCQQCFTKEMADLIKNRDKK